MFVQSASAAACTISEERFGNRNDEGVMFFSLRYGGFFGVLKKAYRPLCAEEKNVYGVYMR